MITGRSCYTSKYVLSDRLVCGECGTLYRRCTWTSLGRKYPVWRCTSRLNYGTKYCHDSPTIKEEPLQAAILAAINSDMSNKAALLDHIKKAVSLELLPVQGQTMSLADIERRLAQLDEQFQRLLAEAIDAEDKESCNTQFAEILAEQRLALQELLDAADKQMEQTGAFKEYAGEFWTAPETRPYMRVRYTYFDVLISCGMMRRAIDEGQRLLELCENDNLGVRYQLMHLYAYMEDELHALALHKQFDSYEETQMLLPLTVLYYKLNQFDKAEDYIKRLAKANKDAKKFLRAAARDQLDDYIDEMNPYGYQPFTMEELLDELMKSSYLFDSVPYFFTWASKVLATKSASKKSAGKPHLLN